MENEWISQDDAKTILDCSIKTIQALYSDGIIEGRHRDEILEFNKATIESLRPIFRSSKKVYDIDSFNIESGLIETSLAVSAIAMAIVAFAPKVSGVPDWLVVLISLLIGLIAVLSAISALWLLSIYRIGKISKSGFREISMLITNPKYGPHWLLGLGLLFWLFIAFFLTYFFFSELINERNQ